ncbi:MAG TPA: DUF1631 domain-containing protein [Methylococcaceae bacterium]|nr:DUF1631 domain-containing protein [Methylococcaceae bacterium]
MAAHDSNVVAFEMPQTKQKDTPKFSATRVIADCKAIFSDRLSELLQSFFAKVDDELFKLSDKAENSTLQSLYFDSMRYVRRERDAVQGQYLQELSQQYDDFWRNQPSGAVVFRTERTGELSEDDFSLVENEILEEDLAINSMIEKGRSLFHRELLALNKRFAVLAEKDEGQIENNNPVGPAALCRQFESALKPLAMDLKIRLLIYKLFDRLILSSIGAVYHDLNAHLVREGILPSITKTITRHTASLAGAARSELGQTVQPGPREGGGQGDNAVYLEAFQSMQSLLEGWRNQLGLPAYSSGIQEGGVVLAGGEVLNALSVLQHPGMGSVGDCAASGEDLKRYLTHQLGKLQFGGQTRPLGRLEGDIIDMVGMIFDFILEDRNLPDPVKALIGRLQIPVVKAAILENSFFAKKNHPTRILLNSLAQAGIGLDVADGDSENPVFKKIEEIVGRILNEFDQDVGLFDELLEDFSAFMEKESQRSRIAEERTRQVTQSKEQVRLAKKNVAYEIASRLRGKETPAIVREFLYNTWKDVMVLAYLRRDKESTSWQNALAVMDKLLFSLTPPAEANVRQEIALAVPALWNAIREGLESISFDPHQVTTLLDDLKTCHKTSLKTLRSAETPAESAVLAPPAFPAGEVVIKDPDLAEAILDIKANLPDVEDIQVGEVRANGIFRPASLAQSSADADEFAKITQALRIGDWLEFADERQNPYRAKLSWKSQVTSLYVFVNRRGVKVCEMNACDLADRLRRRTARIIEGSADPLMDRAFAALMQSLKNPAKKTGAPA